MLGKFKVEYNIVEQIQYKSMSLFRQFNKTVCASRFTKPNNIILNNSCPSVYLCTSQEPSIDHVNTIKSLLRTINRLQGHSKNATYQKFITSQLQMLKDSLGFYTQSCRRYVELGGRLTGQGIANLYACADKLNVNAQWLKVYAQSEIPHLIRYMNVQNLKDLQQGLKKFNGNADFASLVDKQLQTRNQQPEMYVDRAPNELAVFEQVTGSPSNNLLVNMVESKSPIYKYYFHRFSHLSSNLLNSYLKKKPMRYALE